MNEIKPIVEFYVEKRGNLLQNTNIPFVLRDDCVVQYDFEKIPYYPIAGPLIIEFEEAVFANRLIIYTIPFNQTNWGIYEPRGINLFIQFKKGGIWQDCDWNFFNLDGGNDGAQQHIPGSSFVVTNSGILSLYTENLERIEGLKIWSGTYTHRVTEIVLTKIYKFNPINFRINETCTIDDEYTGMSGQATFFDGDRNIKNLVDINDNIYVRIQQDDKIKELNFLYCDKIYHDVENRLTTINFNSKIIQMTSKMINPKTPILGYPNTDFSINAVLELLLLEANFHRDLINLSVAGYMLYYPKYDNILNELNRVLKAAGDTKIFVYQKKLNIFSRSQITPVILKQGIENREVVKWDIYYGLPSINICQTFVDFYHDFKIDFLASERYRQFLFFGEDKWLIQILVGGHYSVKSLLLHKPMQENDNEEIWESVTFWNFQLKTTLNNNRIRIGIGPFPFTLLPRPLTVTIPNQSIADFVDLCVEARSFVIYTEVKEDVFEEYHLLTTKATVIANGQTYSSDYVERDFSSVLSLPEDLYCKLEPLDDEMRISKFSQCFGFYDEIVYEFDTPNCYSYEMCYEQDLGTAEYKASKSSNEIQCVKMVNGAKILSIPGDKIKIYYFSYPCDYVVGDYWWEDPEVDALGYEINDLRIKEPVFLTYYKEDIRDVEQGIIQAYPKNLLYTVATEFDNQQLVTNQIIIKKNNYIAKTNDIIKEQVVIQTNEYNKTFVLNKAIFKQSAKLILKIGDRQYEYTEGEYYNSTEGLFIKFYPMTLQVIVVLTPVSNIYRDTNLIVQANEIVLNTENELVYNNKESQIKYGVISKSLDCDLVTNDTLITNIAKKYLRFAGLPAEILTDNINLNLNIDIDFAKFVQVYDEWQKRRIQIKLLEYEHILDLANDTYETIIKGRILFYEYYRINTNYWGNHDYWGNNPAKYWGGEYYG